MRCSISLLVRKWLERLCKKNLDGFILARFLLISRFCSFGAARMRRVPSTIRNFSKMICRGWNAPRQLPKFPAFPILLSQRQNSTRNIRGNARTSSALCNSSSTLTSSHQLYFLKKKLNDLKIDLPFGPLDVAWLQVPPQSWNKSNYDGCEKDTLTSPLKNSAFNLTVMHW